MITWEENVRDVKPYIPGEQPKGEGIIKLNTNENPYPPSPMIAKCIREFDYDRLKKYPDPDVCDLREAIANYHGVETENVFVGVGSDDVLAMSFMTFFNSSKPVFFPDVTYSFYDVWCELFKIPYRQIPLRDDFSINTGHFAKDNGGVVIANPNAPTGLTLDIDKISQLAYINPGSVVIIDEAYIDFGGESALGLQRKYDNLLIVRTFSKSRALAGSRIGYAIGSRKLISHLMSVRNSFNSYTMDALTMAIGIASINDEHYFRTAVNNVVNTREWAKAELSRLGFLFPDSSANFIFATHRNVRAVNIFEELKKRNIFVRYFDKSRINNFLRITVGTDEEMNILIEALGSMV